MALSLPVTPAGIISTSHENVSTALRKRKFSVSSRSPRKTIEHLPSINPRRLRLEKYVFLTALFGVNFTLIYMSMYLSKYYWILLPMYLLRPLMDVVEILTIAIAYPIRRAHPRHPEVPEALENLVYLLPCYNETKAELMHSLNSLVGQKHLDQHNKAIIIVCDGRYKGKGMTKTTADHLKQDIIENPLITLVQRAYMSWDGSQMDVEVVEGDFRGLPVFCIIKAENRGKRDGIILVRSLLHKFNQRYTKPSASTLSPQFFTQVSDFLVNSSMPSVEYVVGMDADTRFDTECVHYLIKTVREGEHVVGVCGHIQPDFTTSKPYSIFTIYQNAEYAIGQYRRRLRQDLTSRRVTCLPGCCQLLRVIESTCGDEIMGQFGYYPKEQDGLFRTIRSMMSEDRDHVCLVLRENPDVDVRQCLMARAFTSVPQSFTVFLSQRRRWTLGPVTSDVLLAVRKSTGWVERLAAIASTISWAIMPFMFLSRWFREEFDPRTRVMFFAFATFRDIWNLSIVFMSPWSRKEAIQYVIGALMCSFLGPYVSISIVLYSLYHLDDFRWGKTRIVSEDDNKDSHDG
ncbi:hypothetical protein ZTR_01643 [Talaromyces verruculosus]|nr:hypothetical protein ZTR_01643 [Talaromyces verruculosus]